MAIFNIAANRMSGENDDAVLARAMQSADADLTIYFPANGGLGPNGAYEISTESWDIPDQIPARGNITRGNVTLCGDGMYQTVIKQPLGSDLMFMAHVDPAAPTTLLRNITFRDLSLHGNLSDRLKETNYSYNEHNHLVRIAGVSSFRAERVEFKDFMGDGLHLGSPLRALVPHNDRLSVTACRFDGVNNKNRNGISILDCNTWEVLGCAFLNVGDSSRNTPGAIDVEPENGDSIIAAGKVYNTSFENIGGAAVALLSNQTSQASGLEFSHCNVRQCMHVVSVHNYNNITVNNLYVDGISGEPLIIRATNTLVVRGNTFRNAGPVRMGGGTVGVTIKENAFVNCGQGLGPVITQDDNVDGAYVMDNHIIDCGVSGQVSPVYYVQTPTGVVKSLRVNGNRVEAQAAPLKVTDIGRITGGRVNTSSNYRDVNRDGNIPSVIPGGVENLQNQE